MSTAPHMAWTTLDEIQYLRSVAERDGMEINRFGTQFVDARAILGSWLTTCDARRWPPGLSVEQVRREAALLLEGLA